MHYTEKGDLVVNIEVELEKNLFEFIILDARKENPKDLCCSFYQYNIYDDFYDDWIQYSLPDIENTYTEQLQVIQRYTQDLKKNNYTLIKHKDLKACYSGLNQARFVLEKLFKFSDYPNLNNIKDDEEVQLLQKIMESWTTEKKLAYQRNVFYSGFQQCLLDGFGELG